MGCNESERLVPIISLTVHGIVWPEVPVYMFGLLNQSLLLFPVQHGKGPGCPGGGKWLGLPRDGTCQSTSWHDPAASRVRRHRARAGGTRFRLSLLGLALAGAGAGAVENGFQEQRRCGGRGRDESAAACARERRDGSLDLVVSQHLRQFDSVTLCCADA